MAQRDRPEGEDADDSRLPVPEADGFTSGFRRRNLAPHPAGTAPARKATLLGVPKPAQTNGEALPRTVPKNPLAALDEPDAPFEGRTIATKPTPEQHAFPPSAPSQEEFLSSSRYVVTSSFVHGPTKGERERRYVSIEHLAAPAPSIPTRSEAPRAPVKNSAAFKRVRIPKRVGDAPLDPDALDERERALLLRIDGVTPLDGLARALGWSEEDAFEVLARLVRIRIVQSG